MIAIKPSKLFLMSVLPQITKIFDTADRSPNTVFAAR